MTFRQAKNLPKDVERYVEEGKEQGLPEDQAWAVAWSRYCKYKNPGSEHCKMNKGDYFPGRKAEFSGMAARVAARHLKANTVPNPLDGMSKQQGLNLINKVIGKVHLKGIFSDTSWKPVTGVFKALADHSIPLSEQTNAYAKNKDGAPTSKTWKFEIEWLGPKGRPVVGYGIITASGAGSVDDPLKSYDVVAYVS